MTNKTGKIVLPRNLVGKPAAVFFLLNEVEKRKALGTPKTAARATGSLAKADKPIVPGATSPFLLTDQFLFDQSSPASNNLN